jgi:heat shock protein HslJ
MSTILAILQCTAGLILVSLGGCVSMTAKPTVVGTQWRLLEVEGALLPPEAGSSAGLELLAEGNRYAASAGCNRILGTYQLAGDSLRFLPGPMTKMACPDPLGPFEDKLVAALQSVTGYRIGGEYLDLLAGERTVVRLTSPRQ